ncbi:MAG: hypothetical protein QNJ75_09885 [Acidimicrobiia bacterium]|nr:hypothetical protein [Acidimicrobiia bacterium]
MSEIRLGEVALLQVHGDRVKRRDRYDPAPLVQVEEASVTSDGMLGWTGAAWVVDKHHQAWPEPGPRRPLSIGFTSHYAKMRDRYWDISLGAAGENIVIKTDRVIALGDLGERVIVRADGREAVLLPVKVAKPCLQFSSYMRRLPEVGAYEDLAEDMRFLGEGTRGFIVTMLEDGAPVRIRVGDEVLLAP